MVNTLGTVVVLPKKPPCNATEQEKQDYKNLVNAKRNSTQTSSGVNRSKIITNKSYMFRRARKPGTSVGTDICK